MTDKISVADPDHFNTGSEFHFDADLDMTI
jgi:hypothetical protein